MRVETLTIALILAVATMALLGRKLLGKPVFKFIWSMVPFELSLLRYMVMQSVVSFVMLSGRGFHKPRNSRQ